MSKDNAVSKRGVFFIFLACVSAQTCPLPPAPLRRYKDKSRCCQCRGLDQPPAAFFSPSLFALGITRAISHPESFESPRIFRLNL